jgi:hypothetical protein
MKKLQTIIAVLFLVSILFAEDSGIITGTISDKDTGETLPGVQITIENTDLGAVTNIDGYFEIHKIPAGKYELFVEYLGYTSIKILGVDVAGDSTTTVNLKMELANL